MCARSCELHQHLCLHAMRQTCICLKLFTVQKLPRPLYSAIMSAPLCKLSCENFVTWEAVLTLKTSAKTEAEKVLCLLDGFGKACVVGQRFGAANTVVVEDNTDFWFFITTDRKDQNRPRDIKAHLEKYGPAENHKLGNYITVEKVKYFTKITQRRLGWGSAGATEEDVKDAVEKGDKAELLAIMPAAAQLIQRNEFEVLPRLFTDLKQERPALVDCVHTFFKPCQFYNQLGACNKCQKGRAEHLCKNCNAHWCHWCIHEVCNEHDAEKLALKAYHEATQKHNWEPAYVTCDVCMKCEGKRTNFACECGAARCSKCLHVHVWSDAQDTNCRKGCKEPAVKMCACGLAYCWSCCQSEDIIATRLCTFLLEDRSFCTWLTTPNGATRTNWSGL